MGATIGRPGALKTPALTEAQYPLRKLEVRYSENYSKECTAFDENRVIEAEQSKIDKQKIKEHLKNNKAAQAAELAKKQVASDSAPIRRRFQTSDATVEKLGEPLNENPNGIITVRDELSGFLRMLDKPGQEGAR